MLRKVILMFALLSSLFYLASCGGSDDVEPTCKTCSAVVVQEIDGEVLSTSNISGVQYCDEQLSTLEASNPQVITQDFFGTVMKVTTTYTCQ